jgi:N-glycosidase YbiA
MKKLLILFFLILSNYVYALNTDSIDPSEIPHYKIYKPTPLEDYTEDILDFYSVKDPYGEFSNFALFPIFLDGLEWPTSEHYYQAHKYDNPEMIEKVRQAESPMEAAKIGRDPKIEKRADWNDVKDAVMEKAVREKFKTYPILQKLLKQTKNSTIYEHTKNDCYWGDCGDRSGKNKLGILLNNLRSEL